MIPLKDNHDIACFLVTKHSWKGKYKRIFSIGTMGVTTYNPDKLEITNRWPYCDIITLTSSGKQNVSTVNEFSLIMRKDRKIDTMKFSSEYKNLVLTEAFKYRHLFAEKPKENFRYEAYKHHWSDTRMPVVLQVTPCSLDQLDPVTNIPLASYSYSEIEGIIGVQDYPGGFVIACGGFSRLHLFAASNYAEIKNKLLDAASNTLGISIKVLPATITLEDFQNQRFGKYSGDQHQTSISEFDVHKVNSLRHIEPPRRSLCLSDTCVLERDPQTYSVCCLRPLADVWALIRDPENPQLFVIEYMNGQIRCYLAAERDALLASLLDGVRSSGNRDVHVKMNLTPRGKRLGPLHVPVDEETESNHLRFLISALGHSRPEMIERFNANVAYSGLLYSVNQDRLFSENKEKLIAQAIQSLVQTVESKDASMAPSAMELEAQFHALRRLGASKVGFAAFTTITGFREAMGSKVVSALRKGDAGVAHAALDALCALLHPMHSDYDLKQEQLNKSSLLSSKNFLEGLLDMWTEHVTQGSGALVVAAMLDFLTFSLCVPYSETTDSKHFDQLLELVASRGRSVFRLFEHPSMAIVKGGGLVMRALVEEGSAEVGARMQALALSEAALPRHLLAALFGTTRPRHRHLSRHLVGLWATGHPPAMGLLRRILPSGLLSFLDSSEKLPQSALEEEGFNERDNLKLAQDASKNKRGPQWQAVERQIRVFEKHLEHYTQVALQHWSAHTGIVIERKEKQRERPIVLRKRREKIKADANWLMFFYQFTKDHALPNLIWNHKTREELRAALESELRAFNSDRELGGSALVSWNHTELELHYRCLQDEVRIGDYYLRLLLEAEDSPDSPIRKSYEFFNDLYHRFLLTPKIEMKCMCLQAMSIVYGRYYEDIGPFSDTKYIVQMLERSSDRMERDRLVIFLHKLIQHRRNVRDLLEWNGIRILVDLMTLAHLHTSRATVPAQSNVIEAAPNSDQSNADKEWYYNVDKAQGQVERIGPVSFQDLKDLYKSQTITVRTKCWASGMDGWRMLQAIPQLKWTLLAKGSPVFNESELATLILNILIKCCEYFPSRDEDNAIVRPLPKVKRLLSDSYCLAHVVQVLLTFDPILVEKVATLLCEVMQDNPEISKLYMTGIFYFILMYTGSNVLPIARFLQLTHMKQAFRAEDTATSDIMQRSILGQLLPEAMVCYLHNHGADKFAQIFLGEYDTPEAIWNAEMRRMLIVKVSAHIGDFTPRLRVHTGARYPYLAIPAVRYLQLDAELFCNVFYLRHLCDTQRFPDWPIPDPVKLLKDVLEAWKKEVEKKPPIMTVDEAYKSLNLAPGKHHDEAVVRKSYYKLAQMYHPDKNPQGRDQFEAVNQAYEFLCSRSVWTGDGPNPNNIVLVLRAQSILFSRYSQELEPYKYAGYPQLIKTIRMETCDESLFSKSAPLLAAGCELAHHTVSCSALNAEELRREGGLQILLEAYSRCVSVLSLSSKPTDVAVQVCDHISRCYSVAAGFVQCREVIGQMPSLIVDICRILTFKHLGNLCCSAVRCVKALSVDANLQTRLLRCGALWTLLKAALLYDYTLDEGGVERSQEANQQEVANQLAKLSIAACAALGGYLNGEEETPNNQLARNVFNALLTPYLAGKLKNDKPEELLKVMNSNWRNPYLIWDNSTRGELSEFLQNRKQTMATNDEYEDDEDITLCTEFIYSAHKGQLVIGEIFVQIYNEQPTFTIENPKGFTLDLLDFLGQQSRETMDDERIANIVMALKALANVIKTNAGVEIQCIGYFGLIFGLLSARGYPAVQKEALQVVVSSAGCAECVEDVAAGKLLGHLLPLATVGTLQASALDALSALLTNTSIVSEALNKGAVIYLLDLFCNSNSEQLTEGSADLLAKMMAEKLHGPKVKLSLCRYLPAIFADAMRSGGAAAAARMLNTPQQHPELVWDTDAKDRVSAVVARHKDEHFAVQVRDPSAHWNTGADGTVSSLVWSPPGEVVVGGVYLRLFAANPQWTLRSPRTFLADLLDCTMANLQKDSEGQSELLELCTRALCGLLGAQPTLADLVAGRGHLPRLCRYLAASPQHALPILHTVSNSQICVNALAQTECITGLKQAMKNRRDLVGLACEALSRIFSSPANTDELVHQALETDMVGQLLSLLEAGLPSAQVTAQAVSALKAMSRSGPHGERVRLALEKCAAWRQYATQRHDLFIADVPTAGYLTGGIPQTAGYLTQGPTSNITLQPPPVD